MANSSIPAGTGRTGAGFLFFLGFCLIAAGVGFAAAPHYSWTVTKIARQATALGVQNGVLVVGGLILFGLAIVARSRGGSTTVVSSEDDTSGEELHLLNEQLSAKFSQTRTALLQLSEGQRALGSQLQALQQRVEEQPTQQEPAPNQNQDAIFRLAASLDKLNAHFDERIHGIDLQLRSGLETLAGELRRSRSERPAIPAPPVPARREPARSQPSTSMAPEGAIDFYETMQKLDAIAGGAEAGSPPQRRDPPAPFGSSSGTTLDSLLPEEYR